MTALRTGSAWVAGAIGFWLFGPGDGPSPRPDLGLPFGINNAYASSQANTDRHLKDLGVLWISDHFARRNIERMKKCEVTYDFADVDAKLDEYAHQAGCRAWFVVNIESKYEFEDGMVIGSAKKSAGKYLPDGPVSYRAWGDFLRALVKHVNGRVPGWRAELWSIDNEEASLYLPAFCPAGIAAQGGRRAAEAYAEALLFSARIIRELDSQAKIVFGGPGGGTPDDEYRLFYGPALKALAERVPGGGFDFFDYHDFNTCRGYASNPRGKGLDFFRRMLADAGLSGKPIVIKAGATHSGQDLAAANKRLHEMQSEAEQAEYLVKRFVHHAAAGVQLILWGDVREDEERHGTYSHNGLIYNGVPRAGEGDKTAETPCPDPGDGLPKLGYWALKQLVDRMKSCDWTRTETIATDEQGVSVYKFLDAQDRPLWVAWWDGWTDVAEGQDIAIEVGGAASVRVTDALPSATEGAAIDARRYREAFAHRRVPAIGGKATVVLRRSPVFIEIGE